MFNCQQDGTKLPMSGLGLGLRGPALQFASAGLNKGGSTKCYGGPYLKSWRDLFKKSSDFASSEAGCSFKETFLVKSCVDFAHCSKYFT